jgi:Family of unknown function (DUF6866) C-terminal domain/Family of unknown function (DUF6866) N-terminal domain
MRDLHHLIETVQANCDIADARHARETTLCNYLLGMRELYRWEHELPLSHVLSKEDVSAWLAQREAKWEELEELDFRPVHIEGQQFDPFDSAAINRVLMPHGLVYGGGYEHWGNPNFFLAQLQRSEQRSGLTVLVSGCEYARGVAAPPAALNNDTVFLRTDAMQRWLWGRFEIWGVHKADDALSAALDCYGEDGAENKLARMAARESETLILHEVGEALAEPLLGPAWREMLASLGSRRAELLVRAVRDNLADCLATLPELISRGEPGSIHFYFANFDGMRRMVFPRLAEGYERWRESGDIDALVKAYDTGREHWQEEAQRMLDVWQSNDKSVAEATIENWGEHSATLVL